MPTAVANVAPKIVKLNEDTVKALPMPRSGNKVYRFAGQKLQGKVAPAGFGVRVTARGSRAFVLDYRVNGSKRRYTIGEHKESDHGGAWSVIAAIDDSTEAPTRDRQGQ